MGLKLRTVASGRSGSNLDYEKARCAYIEHVVECKDCAWMCWRLLI
jgi:hypothetical protein